MSYERICSTARAVAAQAGVDFVPHTMPQYLALIDRAEHANYIAAVALGNQPAHDDPFDAHLADATDELQASFEALIAEKRLNHIFTAGGAAAILAANNVQLAKIERALHSLMKDCNQQLVAALCVSFKTPAMAAFHHLVNLDFVRAANSGETNLVASRQLTCLMSISSFLADWRMSFSRLHVFLAAPATATSRFSTCQL